MIKTTLKEFLHEGTLGSIAFGVTMHDIKQILGNPDAISDPKSSRQIWKYGKLQVSFDANTLDFIGLYFRSQEDLPKQLQIEGYVPTQLTGLAEFRQYLNQEGIPFNISAVLTFGTQLCLVVGLGIDVVFDINLDELDSMQYMKK